MIDSLLESGGQVLLDVGTLMPFGPMVNAGQAVYHGAHMANDARKGHWGEAASQAGETFWNGVNSIPVIHHMLHPVHIAEAVWDGAATLNRWAKNPLGHIPYALEGVSKLLPRMLGMTIEVVHSEVTRASESAQAAHSAVAAQVA